MSCRHYPYRPTGAVRKSFDRSRRLREQTSRDGRLFLLLGTVEWGPTRDSLLWFLDEIVKKALPNDATLVVAGGGTETLAQQRRFPAQVEVKGRLDQGQFEDHLARAQAVLVPHRCGFGALTRLADVTCAGVPVIVSKQATYGLSTPPGAIPVEDTPEAWGTAMESVRGLEVTREEYDQWYHRQATTLCDVLCEMMGNDGR
jgi:hypothetical protein